jgi:hypothetical protein
LRCRGGSTLLAGDAVLVAVALGRVLFADLGSGSGAEEFLAEAVDVLGDVGEDDDGFAVLQVDTDVRGVAGGGSGVLVDEVAVGGPVDSPEDADAAVRASGGGAGEGGQAPGSPPASISRSP